MTNASFKEMKKIASKLSIHEKQKFNSKEISEFVDNNISLGKREYELYSFLLGMASECNGVAFPSQEYLAKKLEVSRVRINQLVNQLKNKGILFVQQIRQGESPHNFYVIPTLSHLKGVIEDMYSSFDEITNSLQKELKKPSKPMESKEPFKTKEKQVNEGVKEFPTLEAKLNKFQNGSKTNEEKVISILEDISSIKQSKEDKINYF